MVINPRHFIIKKLTFCVVLIEIKKTWLAKGFDKKLTKGIKRSLLCIYRTCLESNLRCYDLLYDWLYNRTERVIYIWWYTWIRRTKVWSTNDGCTFVIYSISVLNISEHVCIYPYESIDYICIVYVRPKSVVYSQILPERLR